MLKYLYLLVVWVNFGPVAIYGAMCFSYRDHGIVNSALAFDDEPGILRPAFEVNRTRQPHPRGPGTMTSKIIRTAFVAGLAVAALSVAACSKKAEDANTAAPAADANAPAATNAMAPAADANAAATNAMAPATNAPAATNAAAPAAAGAMSSAPADAAKKP